jgi:hypothetical protein
MIKLQNNRARNISKMLCRNSQGGYEDYRETPPLRRFIFHNKKWTDRPQEEE